MVKSIVVSVMLSVSAMLGLTAVHQRVATDYVQLVNQNMRLGTVELDGCSGVVIKPNVVLTAAHCDGGQYTVLKKNESLDLMLIWKQGATPTTQLATVAPKVDDRVYAVGYPLGGPQFITEGRVQVVSFPREELKTRMGISAELMFGNSGGGIFNSRGELIGIASAVAAYAVDPWNGIPHVVPHMGLAINYDTIKEFLKDV